MKAVIIREFGSPDVLDIAELPDPQPQGQDVRVKVHAFGLNRADLSQRRGHYPAPAGEPTNIPGIEFSGVVESLGPTALGMMPVGTKVCGIVGGGAYAEYLTIHERLLIPMPKALSFPEAAAIPEGFITAYDALLQASARLGESVLIHAVGSGVGSAAVQICRNAGLTVFGTSRTREKLEAIRGLGIDFPIHSVVEQFETAIERETAGRGVDIILDLVGGSALEENLRSLAMKGRLIFVGLLGGSDSTLNLSTVMKKRLTILGTVLRSRPLEEKISLVQHFAREMLPLFDAGKLKPVLNRVFQLSEIREAHALMEDNQTTGKFVVRVVEDGNI